MKKLSATVFVLLFRIFGIIVLIVGIRLIGAGIYNYINEHNQQDWISTTAYVVDITSEYSSSSRRKPSHVRFDITYQYEVDGKEYSDILHNRDKALALGTPVSIKYDPDNHSDSTDILKPSLQNLIVFLVCGLAIGTAGFFLSGTWALIRKLRRKGKPEEGEELPPEEYVKPEEIKQKSRNTFKAFLIRLALGAIAVCAIILSSKLFPGIQVVDAEKFIDVVEAKGYTTSETTDELSQSWKVGSMMEKAVSINDGNVRMDFCEMDTADSADVLYNAMMLPVTDGEKQDFDGMVHELASAENAELYAAKVRIRDTIIYVSAKVEYKAEVIEILDTLGYWKE